MAFHRIRAPETPTVCMVRIYEDEVERIAEEASRWPDRETGGEIYGYLDNRGTAIGHLFTGPGPKAVHERAHFAQDIDFFVRTHEELNRNHGVDLVVRTHSHNRLGQTHPSRGDAASLASLMARNRIPRMIELIVTIDDATTRHGRSSEDPAHVLRLPARRTTRRWANRRYGVTEYEYTISIHAYQFSLDTGEYRPCEIALLPGSSPIRAALRGGVDNAAEPAEAEDVDSATAAVRGELPSGMPDDFMREWELLPPAVRDACDILQRDDLLLLRVPADRRRALFVAYRTETRVVPLSVYLDNGTGAPPLDLSARALPKAGPLSLTDALGVVVDYYTKRNPPQAVCGGGDECDSEPTKSRKPEIPADASTGTDDREEEMP